MGERKRKRAKDPIEEKGDGTVEDCDRTGELTGKNAGVNRQSDEDAGVEIAEGKEKRSRRKSKHPAPEESKNEDFEGEKEREEEEEEAGHEKKKRKRKHEDKDLVEEKISDGKKKLDGHEKTRKKNAGGGDREGGAAQISSKSTKHKEDAGVDVEKIAKEDKKKKKKKKNVPGINVEEQENQPTVCDESEIREDSTKVPLESEKNKKLEKKKREKRIASDDTADRKVSSDDQQRRKESRQENATANVDPVPSKRKRKKDKHAAALDDAESPEAGDDQEHQEPERKKKKKKFHAVDVAEEQENNSAACYEKKKRKKKLEVAESQDDNKLKQREDERGSSDKQRKEKTKKAERPVSVETGGDLHTCTKNLGNHAESTIRNEKIKKKVSFGAAVVLNEAATEKKVHFGGVELQPTVPNERPLCERRLKDPLYNKKFTEEEDEAIRQAVRQFAETKGLDLHETYKLYLDRETPEQRRLGRELSKALVACLPERNPISVKYRAESVLDIFGQKGIWPPEEVERLQSLVLTHGKRWTLISKLLGRNKRNVATKYYYVNALQKRGKYSSEEIAKVTSTVHNVLAEYARLNVPRHREEDIPWRSIAAKLPGRPESHYRVLWYRDLCSPMVKTKEWGTGDDHLLLRRMLESGAPDEESIDWDNLLSGRSGEICLKRWHEMRVHLGHKWNWPFEKKLELLIERFAPCFLEEPAAACPIVSGPEEQSLQEQH
ncbi:RNA polymerase I termination factor [Selaginella moellendorffii]|nr:RNA polymerase I termination factor [Selaginella moellendorffii]|eukprot:XP_002979951.2 RNA polymerase I termination factor [Selaginella moellendorffii]